MLANIAIDHFVAIWNSSASIGHLLYVYCIRPRRVSCSRRRRSCILRRVGFLLLRVKNRGENRPIIKAVCCRTIGCEGHIGYHCFLHIDRKPVRLQGLAVICQPKCCIIKIEGKWVVGRGYDIVRPVLLCGCDDPIECRVCSRTRFAIRGVRKASPCVWIRSTSC